MRRRHLGRPRFRLLDAVEVAVGCCVMAFPVAAADETWTLSEELSIGRVLLFAAASLFFLAVFIFFLHGHDLEAATGRDFALRVASTYGLTLVICALLLLGIDRLDFSEPLVALKRTLLVAFPGSFAATVVDSFEKPRGEEER